MKNRSTDKLKATTRKYSIKIASLFLSTILLMNSAPIISVSAEEQAGDTVEMTEINEVDETENNEQNEEKEEIEEESETSEEEADLTEEELEDDSSQLTSFAATNGDTTPQQSPEELGHYLVPNAIYENASEITGIATPNALVLVLYPGTPQEISVNVNESGEWILRNVDGNASTLTAGAVVPMTLVIEKNGTRFEYDYEFVVQSAEGNNQDDPSNQEQADLFEPQASSSLALNLTEENLPTDTEVITNFNELPEGTELNYQNLDELRAVEEGLLEVQIIYPDGSIEALAVPTQLIGEIEIPAEDDMTSPEESTSSEEEVSSTDIDTTEQVGSSDLKDNTGSSQSNNREVSDSSINLNDTENIASNDSNTNNINSELNVNEKKSESTDTPETLPETGESVNGSALGIVSLTAGLGLIFIDKKKETKEA